MNGKDYFWCTGDHYSSGKKYNGMYADHKSADHGMWHKTIDDHCVTRTSGKSSNDTPAPATPAIAQKLTLNDKLWNAFCTQAGLSAEADDCIWEDAQKNELVQITGGVVQGYWHFFVSFYHFQFK